MMESKVSDFTTRPEIRGTFGVVTSTHWIASRVGMSILEKGGNAFDASVATALVLQVVEPHLNGPAGDMPAIFYSTKTGRVEVLCAQGPAPEAATVEHYREQGLTLIPGSGLLATVVPGAFDGWMLMLRDHGTMPLRDVMQPAIDYARDGHPMLPRVADTIAGLQEYFEKEWPTSADVWAPGGQAPSPHELFKNPDLADTCERLASAEGDTREARIDAAQAEWREGFVADAIFDYLKDAQVMDVSEARHSATMIEAMKLAYADCEAYYGDPDHSDIPMDALLGEDCNAERCTLITDEASLEQRPGRVPGFEHLADAYIERAARDFDVGTIAAQEPTMSHLTEKRGDTVHLDVIDRWGNMVAATPSGGWLQSNPVIPGLGFPLNSRAQMCWLEHGLPTSLAPGRRPRTTLTPSLAEKDGTQLVFGTPGGDQQDGIDQPLLHSMHFQGSFFPREVRPGEMMIEPNVGEDVIADLRERGHKVTVAEPWTISRLTAALREPSGMLRAAATPRLMQVYAVGR